MIDSEKVTPGSVFLFTAEQDGVRLDQFVSNQFTTYSRNFFKTLIENEQVLVNEKVPHKAGVILKVGDKVSVTFPQPPVPKEYNQAELDALEIEIIFQHDDFIVIYKPAGVLVHPPSEKSVELCLTDWITGSFKGMKHVGYTNRPGIVHRLDKDTSGLMLVALTNESHAQLSDLFKNRTISKTYLAIVKGHPEKEGIIDFPIGRHHTIRNRMAHVPHGRASQSPYKVIEYFEDTALVQVKPITGRTHQIRVHFATQGNSIIGDSLYGNSSKKIKRQALHAHKLAFDYKDKHYEFEKEPPNDFSKLLKGLKKIEN
jgi:23S rRNA pseudouridine1911/1915/1917 synthase